MRNLILYSLFFFSLAIFAQDKDKKKKCAKGKTCCQKGKHCSKDKEKEEKTAEMKPESKAN